MFVVAQPNDEGKSLPGVVLIIILCIVALMYIGAAIIAGVWGKEALGGGVLMADGALLFIAVAYMTEGFKDFFHSEPDIIMLVLTAFLPPLIAGYLFLVCHRNSKRQKAQQT